MNKLYYFTLLLAVGFGSIQRVLAQRPPIYQPIGSSDDDKYPAPLTEPLLILLPVPMSEASLNKEYKTPTDRASYLADVAARRAALADLVHEAHGQLHGVDPLRAGHQRDPLLRPGVEQQGRPGPPGMPNNMY